MAASATKRSAIGERMRARMRELRLSYGALAVLVANATDGGPPVSDAAVYKWLAKPEVLHPSRVFAIEVALEVPPGTFSRELGYLPADLPTVSAEDAIRQDPRLSERDRIILLATLLSALTTPE